MEQDYFGGVGGAVKKTVLLAPVSVTADGNTTAVDITALSGKCLMDLAIFNTSGTLPTLNVKLQQSDTVVSITTITAVCTGDGTITEIQAGPDSVAETITATLTGTGTTFTVSGGSTGAMADGVVGTKYESAQCSFVITEGATPFVSGDVFTFHTAARTYTDVTGGSFTQVAAAKSLTYKSLNADELGKYLRLNLDISGTASPSYIVGANIFGFTR